MSVEPIGDSCMQLGQSSRVQASVFGLKKLRKAKDSQRSDDAKRLTPERIAEKAHVSESSVKRFFKGERVYSDIAQAITEALGLKLQEVIDTSESEPTKANSEIAQKLLIAHRQVCQAMLAEQRRLTTNSLTIGDGTTFEREAVYVPLGLIERFRQAKRPYDVSPEQGSKLLEPTEYEVIQRFEYNQFFEQVIRQGISPKTKGKHIGIIGEPGAGKTTLLQHIANWVFNETEQDVVIWVSLADLQGRTLKDYLFDVWLKDALKTARVTLEMEDALVELFNRGRVWLLLDGVDEMAVGNPLQAIASQLRGWVASARFVLSCRLNVWDAGKNALESFDVYRNLDFSDTQREEFISRWFADSPELGKRLQTQLNKPGKERIRDLVKNPLRLTLLCYFWLRREGELPATKAALYQRFVEVFYEWKQEHFPTTSAQQEELKQALGELACMAINQSSSRFRLTRRQVCKIIGEADAPLFQLAVRQLNWLVQVGVAEEDPNEPVYAFFHPTFQEYFAALAINDRHYFLNHVPHKPAQGTYRIFEPQWKEVILLWLGREDVAKEHKENFIKALVEFEDGCEGLYDYQAFFLAAFGITEFPHFSLSAKVISQLVQWGFGYFNTENQEWLTLFKPIEEGARKTLQKTADPKKAIAALTELLHTCEDDLIRIQVAECLGHIDKDNPDAIAVLTHLVRLNGDLVRNQDKLSELFNISSSFLTKYFAQNNALFSYIERASFNLLAWDNLGIFKTEYLLNMAFIDIPNKAADSLGKIAPGNQEAVNAVLECQDNNPLRVASFLKKVGVDNLDAINTLIELLRTSDDDLAYPPIAYSLEKIAFKNPNAIQSLIRLLETDCEEKKCEYYIRILGNIADGNPDAIKIIIKLLHTSNKELRRQCAESLWKIEPKNSDIIAALKALLHTRCHDEACWVATLSLVETEQNKSDAIKALIDMLATIYCRSPDKSTYFIDNLQRKYFNIFAKIAFENQDAISAVTHLLQVSKNKIVIWELAILLESISPGNQDAIKALTELWQNSKDEEDYILNAGQLYSMANENLDAINGITQIILTGQTERIRGDAAWELSHIVTGNSDATTAIIHLLRTAQNTWTRSTAVDSLKNILADNLFLAAVTGLKDCLTEQVYKNDFDLYEHCFELMWHCAQNMSYHDFYRAWHSEPSPVQTLEHQFTDIASELQPTDKTYPILINAHALEDETDTSALAQELCNQIYLIVFPNNPEIPVVNNAPQLKRILPQIKKQLQKQNLALILDKCEPHQTLITFCRKLTDMLHIAWITNQPLEPPLRGFLPEQQNLRSAIQSWINEIG